jgi:amino acid adenylation domain-containing protein
MSLEATLKAQDFTTQIESETCSNYSEKEIIPEKLFKSERSLELSTNHLKLTLDSHQANSYSFILSDCLTESLTGQTKAHVAENSTSIEPKSLLPAALSALLYRYTQQETICLDLTVLDAALHCVQRSEFYMSLTGDLTAQSLLAQVSSALQLLPAQFNPNSNDRSPISVAVTVIETAAEVDDRELTASEADLHLILLTQAQPLAARLHYNPARFQADAIQRLAEHLQILSAGMVQQPDCPIAQLPLLSPAEIQHLITSGRGAPVVYPPDPIHQRIEAQAHQQPEAIAVTFADCKLTYDALNQRANQLAHFLITQGVGKGVAVAVCVEPSLEIAIALLAVFKTGGIYVPLDPSYPVERLATMLADTRPQMMLTQAQLESRLPDLEAKVFCLDRDWEQLQSQPLHNPQREIELDQTAYLVYTSGTTGKPKGVMVSHRNLLNYIWVAQEQYGFHAQDVMPAIARFTFSITMFELLSPLVAGGTLVILTREHILDFQRLVQTLEQITVLHTSPSLMRKLLTYIQEQRLDIQRFQRLRHISCGGDLVPADLLETMKSVFPTAEVYVIYGCSEISCMGCTYFVPRDQPTPTRVGKPFPNVSLRLYDAQRHLVPIGAVGEIYIGGAGVTQGYLHQADLTQERFVTIDGERFYRTGDLGRLDAAGNLEVLGRNDFQIQLRGMRIEPGEIETTLRQLPEVRDAVVMARDLGLGEPGLVAYVVLKQSAAIEADTWGAIEPLRRFLQVKLPDYMVPAVFVPLAAMPLTPNQKIDRRSLPAPDLVSLYRAQTAYVAPRTPLESAMAEIWTSILAVEPVGIHDDFFALGGHSLLATLVVDRLRATLKLEIPIQRLFEVPTIAEFAADLELRQQTQPTDDKATGSFAPIVPLPRKTEVPLSATQSGLWFLSQLDEGCALNIPLAFELAGTVQFEALERSLTEIVRRHETLRTVYPVVQGVPAQQVLPAAPFTPEVVDFRSLSEAEQAIAVPRSVQAAAQHPFDLTQDLPLKVTLLRLSDTAQVLLLTIHHIAADGWSLAVFRRELAALYGAFVQGLDSPLAELSIQYADFVHWQQRWLQGDLVTQQLAYWQRQLAAAPPLLELPTDRPRPAIQTFRGGTEFFVLDQKLTQHLKHLSQRTRSTLFMTLLTAFAVLLSRYSGQSDLVIGSPIANRHRRELEPLIGFFINVLALRVDLSENPDFLTLLQRVRQVTLDAYAHQDVPFGQVREAVQPERNLSHNPLFQVMFILQNSPDQEFELPGLTIAPLHVESGVSQYDLRLMLEETPTGLTGEFEYNRDLFDRSTIQRWVSHFQTLLQAIVADPTRSIASLPLLTATEQEQLLLSGVASVPPQQCIHELFEAQAERTPSAIAVMSEQASLTYAELNQRANQLAHYLRAQQVGADDRVAICAERSLEMLIAFLGVLKAGAAYVPIDPAYPPERRAYMLRDAQAQVILTQAHLATGLPDFRTHVVRLDADWATIAQQPTANLPRQITPANLAYVIYTSGSTGNPKGVMITHQGLVNHSTAIADLGALQPGDRVLQFSSLSFDIAVEELFPSLMRGCTIVLRTEACLAVPHFVRFVAEHGITVLDLPTAFWHEIVNELPNLERFPDSVRLVIVGGEKALRSAYMAWSDLVGPKVRWLNTYGPTETTVTATVYDPAATATDSSLSEIPIGRPIANVATYVLDQHLNLQPIGVPGELYIGGAGVARGYLNRPDLTQEKFIPHPFGGDRLYKTGDLVRCLPDGNLEFLGRLDQQVKIRGFRIELGEIEAVLNQHPQVRDAVVTARTEPSGQQLVAYVVPHASAESPEPAPIVSLLRQFLRDRLPDYMLPTAIVPLPVLPLTPNGKVDRRALPAPDLTATNQRPFVAPRNAIERQLVELWQSLLGVQSISITDNFFDLGGHSLLAVRLWSKIEPLFGRELPLATLYQAPTIEQLAASLYQPESQSVCRSLVILQPGTANAAQRPLFCIHILGRGMKFYRPMLQYLDPELPVYGLSTNISGEPLPCDRVEGLAAYYLQQLQSIQPVGPYRLIGVSFGGMMAFEIAQQLRQRGEQVEFLGLLDTFGPGAVRPSSIDRQLEEHWRYLSSIGPSYLVRKLGRKGLGVWKKFMSNLFDVYHEAGLRWLMATGQALPENFQDFMYEAQSRRLAGTYTLQPYAGRVTLFKASESVPNISLEIDPALGWRPFVIGELDIQEIPGTHLSILQAPQVQILAEKLQACLQRSTEQSPRQS